MVRIGVQHHNVRRRATADNENLHDEPALTHLLGERLDLLLHRHDSAPPLDHGPLSSGNLTSPGSGARRS
jgi:fructosamine-3-kinase